MTEKQKKKTHKKSKNKEANQEGNNKVLYKLITCYTDSQPLSQVITNPSEM